MTPRSEPTMPQCTGCGGHLDAVGRGGVCLHCNFPVIATFRFVRWFGPRCRWRRLRAGTFIWVLSNGIWLTAVGLWSWIHIFQTQNGVWRTLALPLRWFFPYGPYTFALRSYPPPSDDPPVLLVGGYLALSWLTFFLACWCLGLAPSRQGAREIAIPVRWLGPLLVLMGVGTEIFFLNRWNAIPESNLRLEQLIDTTFNVFVALHFFLLARRIGDHWLQPLGDLILFTAAIACGYLFGMRFFEWYFDSTRWTMSHTMVPRILPSLLAVLYLPFILRLDQVIVAARTATAPEEARREESLHDALSAPSPG